MEQVLFSSHFLSNYMLTSSMQTLSAPILHELVVPELVRHKTLGNLDAIRYLRGLFRNVSWHLALRRENN